VDDTEDWIEFYDQALADGDEGIVIKRIGVPYRKHSRNGKSRDWIRVKPHRDQDLFAIGPDRTEGGALTVQVGLWENGRAKRVQNLQLPTARLVNGELMYINPETRKLESLVGKVFTARCREVWDSGGMRGAAFLRWRADKTPEMCDGVVTLVDM
jgi:ATP-dependent DNA ligase